MVCDLGPNRYFKGEDVVVTLPKIKKVSTLMIMKSSNTKANVLQSYEMLGYFLRTVMQFSSDFEYLIHDRVSQAIPKSVNTL
jgi:hypothetical protein